MEAKKIDADDWVVCKTKEFASISDPEFSVGVAEATSDGAHSIINIVHPARFRGIKINILKEKLIPLPKPPNGMVGTEDLFEMIILLARENENLGKIIEIFNNKTA